jgi:predicted amidophosphoribosyltransferase
MRYEIRYIGEYHKYWLDRDAGIKNPHRNWFTGVILDVKTQKKPGLLFFYKRLESIIPKNVVLCSVPSSDSSKTLTGIRLIAQQLARAGRIDGTSCLVRTVSIPKASHGGPRSIQKHLKTIIVENGDLVRGKDVYILDDVTTTGNSLQACAQLLEPFNPGSITCLALGQTVRE